MDKIGIGILTTQIVFMVKIINKFSIRIKIGEQESRILINLGKVKIELKSTIIN
jgi:hypothetical protein